MGKPIARFAFKAVSAAFLAMLSLNQASAQPTPHPQPHPQITPGRPDLPGFPSDRPVSAPAYKSISCRPIATGASNLNKGVAGILDDPFRKLPPHVYVTCSEIGLATTKKPTSWYFFALISPDNQEFASHALSIIGAAHLSGKLLNIVYDENDRTVTSATTKPIFSIEIVDAPPPG